MNCIQSRPGFELVSPCPYPTIAITPWHWHYFLVSFFYSISTSLGSLRPKPYLISRTLIWGGLTPLQRCSQCIRQPQPTGQLIRRERLYKYILWEQETRFILIKLLNSRKRQRFLIQNLFCWKMFLKYFKDIWKMFLKMSDPFQLKGLRQIFPLVAEINNFKFIV